MLEVTLQCVLVTEFACSLPKFLDNVIQVEAEGRSHLGAYGLCLCPNTILLSVDIDSRVIRKKDSLPPPISDAHWSLDMIWTLLSEVEKDENRLVLFRKRDKEVSGHNTLGDK
ncbi:hypothetical protein BDR06DRAFT_443067 [Suillus hirtellus]|nr:hypothetical protein BDR06DRAFT_443067 [Suillus hirtellus]